MKRAAVASASPEESEGERAPKRRGPARNAAAKTAGRFADSDDEELPAENQHPNTSQDEDEEEQQSSKRPAKRGRGKGSQRGGGGVKAAKKSKRRDDDDDDDDEEEDGAAEFESSAADRALLESDGDSDADEDDLADMKDSDFEVGHIIKVEVENFMNHRHFTLNLHRHMNFITGRNGSGKSAIAVALMLCLGSRAKVTGRALNLAKMIREGSPGPAIIRVTLRNEGDLAFNKNGDYGDRICIMRTITKTTTGNAGSTFKVLSNKNGMGLIQVGDGKKLVDSILEHFSIFVENPCCVLTQEESKKFIQGKEGAKYEFFVKATGLLKMKEENSRVKDALEKAKEKVDNFKPTVLAKRDNVKKLKEELSEVMGFAEEELKIAKVACRSFWVDVMAKEGELEELDEALATSKAEHEKAKASFEQRERAQKEEGDREALEAEAAQSKETLARIEADLQEVQTKAKALTKRSVNHENLLREKEAEKKNNTKRLAATRKEIQDLRAKAQGDGGASEGGLIKKLEDTEEKIQDMVTIEREQREEQSKVRGEKRDLDQNKRLGRDATASIEKDIKKLKDQLTDLTSSGSSLALFGDNVTSILDRARTIPALRDGGLKGPVGAFIKLKDGFEDWEPAVLRCLQPVLFSFIVSTSAQRAEATRLIKQNRGRPSQFVITQRWDSARSQRYNVNKFDRLPAGVHAILDLLVIEDDQVFNAIVDQVRAESCVAAVSDNFIDNHLIEAKNGGIGFQWAGGNKINKAFNKEGWFQVSLTKNNNKDTQALDRRQQQPRRLLVKDMSVIVASKKAEIQAKEAELREARDSQPNFDQEDRELTRRNAATDQVLRNCSDQLRILRKSKSSIEDKLKEHQEARNINTTYLEEEERELTEALENTDKVILEMQESNADLTAEKARLKAEQTALTAAKDEASNVIADVTSRITSIIDNIQKHKRAVDSARSNMERTLKILTQTSKTVEKTEEERNVAFEVATEETRNRVQNWDGEPLPVSNKDKDKKKLEQTVKLMKNALEKSELLCFDLYLSSPLLSSFLSFFPFSGGLLTLLHTSLLPSPLLHQQSAKRRAWPGARLRWSSSASTRPRKTSKPPKSASPRFPRTSRTSLPIAMRAASSTRPCESATAASCRSTFKTT